MKCPTETPQSVELLLAYIANKRDGEDAALAEHAAFCPACRAFIRAQGAVSEALDTWEAPPVSADFDRRLYQRIQNQVSWWDVLMRPFRPLLVRQGLPIAATAGLVLVAGLLFEHPANISPSDVPQSAQVEAMPPEQLEHALDEMETMREFNRLVRPDKAEPKM